MRLQKFIEGDLILEKVSKKDISSILNSTDVLVGVEFEFMTYFLEGAQDNYDAMDSLYKDACDAYYDYEQDRENWEERDEESDEPPPDIPQQLIEYDSGYSNYSAGDEIPEPVEPTNYYDVDNNEDDWVNCIENFIQNQAGLPPFDGYKIVGEHGHRDIRRWVIEQDGSLGGYGMEIKSPILSLKDFVDICPKVFDWIDDMTGYTDGSCGFHIHMSLRNVPDLSKNLDLVKLMMFTDEGYIYNLFPERIDNQYTESMKRKLKSENISNEDMKKFIDTKKLNTKIAESHYNAINWEGLSDDKQHIEFRYMGGLNYHKKWREIKTIVAQYAYNLDLACNPNSHKKEYIKKIQRMINKLDVIRYRKLQKRFELYSSLDHSEVPEISDILMEKSKEYGRKAKIWDDVYKVNNEDAYRYNPDIGPECIKVLTEIFSIYRKKGGKKNLKKFLRTFEEEY